MKNLSDGIQNPDQPFSYSLLRYSSYSFNKVVNRIPNWKNKNILIVDSDETNACLLKNYLTKTRATLINAPSDKKAVQICNSNLKVDLVIMDIQIPEMKAQGAAQSIKSTKVNLPVIGQAHNANESDINQIFKAGCDGFLEKPVSQENLFRVLSKFL
jgi:CheY-like chemotaxis protein